MKNAIQSDLQATVAAPYDLTGGQMAKVGSILGVATYDALTGADVVVERRGTFDLAKATGEAWTVGLKLYWDDTAKKVTSTASGNTLIGAAGASAQTADTTGLVILDGAVR